MGNNTEFERAVLWLSDNLKFDVDARINLFEVLLHLIKELLVKTWILFYYNLPLKYSNFDKADGCCLFMSSKSKLCLKAINCVLISLVANL